MRSRPTGYDQSQDFGRFSVARLKLALLELFKLASMLRALLIAACLLPTRAMPNTTGKICQWGCYDEEDEACHAGLTNMQCAEIYGHLVIGNVCVCVTYLQG